MLPDNYIKKMKQDIRELEAQIESKTRLIPFFEDDPPPDSDFSPPPDDGRCLVHLTSLPY